MNKILYTVPNRDKFFEETSKRYEDILQDYKDNLFFSIDGIWEVVPIYSLSEHHSNVNQIKNLKVIKDNIDSVTDYTILSLGISIYHPGRIRSPHIDPQPIDQPRFKRYHLPLQLTDTSFLYVKDNNEDTDFRKYKWELGKWMRFERMDLMHYPFNEDENGKLRIMIIMDIIDGIATQEEIDRYYSIQIY